MTLRVTVDHHSGETRVSLLSRLAIANGYRSLHAFLALNGVSVMPFERGDPEALKRLSDWSGVPIEHLSSFDIISNGAGATWKLGSALMSKEMRPGQTQRYCPKCVMADLSKESGRPTSRPYVRVNWMTKAVQTCEEHGSAIQEAVCDNQSYGDFARFAADNLALIERQASESPTPNGHLGQYITKRIVGAPGNAFLDTFEAYVVHDFCRYFGAFATTNGSVDLAVEDRCAKEIDEGFKNAAQGPARIEAIIADAAQRKKPLAHEMAMFFGELRRWLRRNCEKPEFQQLVELLQGIVERNLPLGKDDLFVLPTRQRHLHSVRSAALDYGLPDDRVKKLVVHAGLMHPSRLSPGRCYFDAKKAHPVLSAALDTMTSVEVAAALGIHPNRLQLIFDAKLLHRVEVAQPGVRPFTRVHSLDYQKFAERLTARAASDTERAVLVDVHSATRRTFCNIAEVVGLALEGNLKSLRRLDDSGIISGLGLDVAELKPLLVSIRTTEASVSEIAVYDPSDPNPSLLNAEQTKERLRTTTGTVAELLRLNFFKLVDAANPATKRVQKYVCKKSVDDFSARHISLSALAEQTGIFGATLRSKLTGAGISPVYEPTARNARFYKRSDLERLNLRL